MNPLALIVTAIAAITAPQLTQTDDAGLIAYFDGPCPQPDWTEYSGLHGKVPVGADGATYVLGDIGGEATHTLIVSEMPSHTHSYNSHIGTDGDSGWCFTKETCSNAYSNWYAMISSNPTGGGTSHNNMQPYLALRPCIKLYSVNYTTQAEFDSLKENMTIQINQLENNVTSLSSQKKGLNNQVNELQNALSNDTYFWVWNVANSTFMLFGFIYILLHMRKNKNNSRLLQ